MIAFGIAVAAFVSVLLLAVALIDLPDESCACPNTCPDHPTKGTAE